MRKILLAMLFIFLLIGSFVTAFSSSLVSAKTIQDSWNTKTPMPQERWCMGVVTVEGKIYVIGGYSFSGNSAGINERYDPKTDKWTTLASMPTWRASFAITAYQGKIYCIGGDVPNPDYIAPGTNSGLPCNVVEVYDTVTNSWSTKTPLPVKGSFIQACTVDGKIFVLNNTALYMYDPDNDKWTAKTSMPIIPTQSSSVFLAAVDDDNLFVFDVNRVMIYNVKTDVWREGQAYPTSIYGTAVGATSGIYAPKRIYILGASGSSLQMTTWGYNPAGDTWSTAMAMPTYRLFFGVAVVDDVLYAVGGATSFRTVREGYFAINEQYVPLDYTGTLPPATDLSKLESSTPSPSTFNQQLPKADDDSVSDTAFSSNSVYGVSFIVITLIAVILTAIIVIPIAIVLTIKKRNK
jgi:N-acetylneuraminic acid mutarotase